MKAEEIENRFQTVCDAVGKALAETAHPLIAEIVRLQAENAELAAALEAVKTATCDWTANAAHGGWEAACGLAWQFTTGTPESNGLWHCPRCGRKVQIYE